jgi:hypothetical protein
MNKYIEDQIDNTIRDIYSDCLYHYRPLDINNKVLEDILRKLVENCVAYQEGLDDPYRSSSFRYIGDE